MLLLQSKPPAVPVEEQNSNAELEAASLVLQQLGETPAWERNWSAALLRPPPTTSERVIQPVVSLLQLH